MCIDLFTPTLCVQQFMHINSSRESGPFIVTCNVLISNRMILTIGPPNLAILHRMKYIPQKMSPSLVASSHALIRCILSIKDFCAPPLFSLILYHLPVSLSSSIIICLHQMHSFYQRFKIICTLFQHHNHLLQYSILITLSVYVM